MSIITPAAALVPVQTREDPIDCTLFAQRVAGTEVGDMTLVNAWYAACLRALTTLGWAGRKATRASRKTTWPATVPPRTTPRAALRR